MICALRHRHADLCEGRVEWHHVVKQQRLRREFRYGARYDVERAVYVPATRYSAVVHSTTGRRTLDSILGDRRNLLWLCHHHHELVTAGRITLEVPDSVWRFASEYGLTGMLENDLAKLT